MVVANVEAEYAASVTTYLGYTALHTAAFSSNDPDQISELIAAQPESLEKEILVRWRGAMSSP